MEDNTLQFGPNGGLVFCMEYFANNFGWLENCLGHVEDDYILFDCPGQVGLYTPACDEAASSSSWNSGSFESVEFFLLILSSWWSHSSLFLAFWQPWSAMISLEIPQVNIMTKMDLLSKKAKKGSEKFLDQTCILY